MNMHDEIEGLGLHVDLAESLYGDAPGLEELEATRELLRLVSSVGLDASLRCLRAAAHRRRRPRRTGTQRRGNYRE